MNKQNPYSAIPLDYIPTITVTLNAEALHRPASVKPEIIKIEGEDQICLRQTVVVCQQKKVLEVIKED